MPTGQRYWLSRTVRTELCRTRAKRGVKGWADLGRVLLLGIILMTIGVTRVQGQLSGSGIRCEREGEEYYISGISDDPCITCSCQSREVMCIREQCPSMEGCHTILFQPDTLTCCSTCKGCYFRGRQYKSGEDWVDESNPCQHYSCQAGVVTASRIQCQTPCSNPTYIPGQCCPVCSGVDPYTDYNAQTLDLDLQGPMKGCSVGGNSYLEGDTFPSPGDSCNQCVCSNNSVVCQRLACPVLNCPLRYIYTPPGSCCPACTGVRQVFDPGRRACLFRNEVFSNGKSLRPDNCTNCLCVDGTMQCRRADCPPIHCPVGEYVIFDKSACCPRCERPKRSCKYKYKKYKHGKTWYPDECTTCMCEDGLASCEVNQCSNEVVQCPQNTKLQYVPGKCCPECVDDEAVCTVFGDPHYRSFDGTIFNFQGTCNYILARDCLNQDFSIHVRNDVRRNNDFAWTKSVTIRMGQTRVYLLQNNRIKVNRKRVPIPYGGHGLKVTGSQHTVTVKTSHGVKVVWDGDSYLEVSVPPAYKGKMCGLCGNYNNDMADDLVGRDGNIYFDPEEFGETWKVGKALLCFSRKTGGQGGLSESRQSCDSKEEKQRAQRECAVFEKDVFELCKDLVDRAPYYESCMTDVCDCPVDKKCACESIKAYVRECQRKRVNIDWSPKLCQEKVCPANAHWTSCADPCPRSCDNLKEPIRCRQLCQEGCECLSGYIFYEDRCIKPIHCPTRAMTSVVAMATTTTEPSSASKEVEEPPPTKTDTTAENNNNNKQKNKKKKDRKRKKKRKKKKDKNKNTRGKDRNKDNKEKSAAVVNSNAPSAEEEDDGDAGVEFDIFGRDLFNLLDGDV